MLPLIAISEVRNDMMAMPDKVNRALRWLRSRKILFKRVVSRFEEFILLFYRSIPSEVPVTQKSLQTLFPTSNSPPASQNLNCACKVCEKKF